MLPAKSSSAPVTLQQVESSRRGCWRHNNAQVIPAYRREHSPILNPHPNNNNKHSGAGVLQYYYYHANKRWRNVVIVKTSNDDSPSGAAVPSPETTKAGSTGGSDWRGWLVGVIMSVLLPFWRNQLWSLKNIQINIESALATAEEMVEMVEEVAETVEEIADEIGEKLPEGKLKEMVENVEEAADKAGKVAEAVQQVINKGEAGCDFFDWYDIRAMQDEQAKQLNMIAKLESRVHELEKENNILVKQLSTSRDNDTPPGVVDASKPCNDDVKKELEVVKQRLAEVEKSLSRIVIN